MEYEIQKVFPLDRRSIKPLWASYELFAVEEEQP